MKLKRILTVAAALVVAAVVAVVAILSTMDFEELRGVIEEKAEEATGRKLTIAGSIDLVISLNPAIALEDVTFANAPWGSRKEMVTVKRFEVEVALLPLITGDIQVNRLVLIEPDILLETDAKGRPNWQMKAAGAKAEKAKESEEAADLPSIHKVLIRDGRLTYLNGISGAKTQIDIEELEINAGGLLSPMTVELRGSVNGMSVRLDGTLGSLDQMLDEQVFPVDFKLVTGGSDLAGKGTFSLAGRRPMLTGDFTSETLDLADFQTPDAAQPAAEAQGKQKFVFTKDPLPFDALKTIDAKMKLGIGVLRLGKGLELTKVDLNLNLKGGQLALAPLGATLSGGRISGDVKLDAGKKTPPLALNLSAKGIDYGRLLKDMDIADGITGTLDGSVKLRGAGASARAIAASLNGHIEVIGGQGTIDNDLMKATGTGLLQMLGGWRQGSSDLRINCVVVRLPVKAGVVTSEAILLDTATVTVGGKGKVDLRNESVNLRVTPQAKAAGLMSLAVPFLVSGTLADPKFGPDPVGTVVGVAKIAGLLINPLVAGAALIVESETADQNPCVAALDQAGKGGTAQPQPSGNIVEDAAKGVGEVLEGVGEGISKGLKSLFGN